MIKDAPIHVRLSRSDGPRSLRGVDLTLPIPDDLAARLTRPELRRLLSFETRYELDGFLKACGASTSP